MATVSAPSGNVYVFDPVIFTITGSGEFDIVIDGVSTKVSDFSGSVKFNASGILRSLFTIATLSSGTVQKSVAWSISQSGSTISSGTLTAIYGSNKTVTFTGDGKHVTLRWISRAGVLSTREFCLYQDSRKIEDIQSAEKSGLTYKIDFKRTNKIQLYAALVERDEYDDLTAIQESTVVQASTSDGWLNVSVDAKEYKRTREALQDFDITIVLPDER